MLVNSGLYLVDSQHKYHARHGHGAQFGSSAINQAFAREEMTNRRSDFAAIPSLVLSKCDLYHRKPVIQPRHTGFFRQLRGRVVGSE